MQGLGPLHEHLIGRLQRWWGTFVHWFPLAGWISYPPLLLSLVAVLLVLAGLGTGLGVPSLVWHDRWMTQLLAGLAAAGLCLHLGMTGYLLDSRDREASREGEATVGEIARYVVWPSLALLLVAGFGIARQHHVRWHGVWVMVGPLAAFIGVIVWIQSEVLISTVMPRFLREAAKQALKRQGDKVRWAHDSDIDPAPHAVQGVWMGLLTGLYVGACLVPALVPAAVAAMVGLALLTGIWGLFAFWMRRYRWIGLGLVLSLAFVLGVTKDLPPAGVSKVTLACDPATPTTLVDDVQALEAWKQRRGGARQPLVVVTASGGASRSALWTFTVLEALSERVPGFMGHVRIMTGASGGMVGAAHYVAALSEKGLSPDVAIVRAGVAADSLTAVTRALILPGVERGRALELAWEANSQQRLAQPFVALKAGEREGWRPSLIFAPMMVEDGRRLIVSNLSLGAIAHTLGAIDPAGRAKSICLGDAACDRSVSAVELFACPGEGLDLLRLSTVARMNATFPWVTSAARLPSTPPRRVVDAGYYDNYGVDIASLWLRKNAKWLKDNTAGVLLVQIRDGLSVQQRQSVHVPGGSGYLAQRYSFLSTPVEGIIEAWDASMAFRNDDLVGMLASNPLLADPPGFFATTLFELPGEAPLSWYLSAEAIETISAKPEDKALAQVASWWKARRGE